LQLFVSICQTSFNPAKRRECFSQIICRKIRFDYNAGFDEFWHLWLCLSQFVLL
jgi:hypothetical protein